ncbi:MAG: S-layer homology domain-containing protein [Candidatus Electrothrix sp. LOE1_4_5]|nr:S-layer homology domain-containing protein [Candidatus Electrothrix gigas]
MNDISEDDWWRNYAQTVVDASAMSLDVNNNFRPLDNVTFLESLKSSMKVFSFNVNNKCDYEVFYPSEPYI